MRRAEPSSARTIQFSLQRTKRYFSMVHFTPRFGQHVRLSDFLRIYYISITLNNIILNIELIQNTFMHLKYINKINNKLMRKAGSECLVLVLEQPPFYVLSFNNTKVIFYYFPDLIQLLKKKSVKLFQDYFNCLLKFQTNHFYSIKPPETFFLYKMKTSCFLSQGTVFQVKV